MTANRLILIDGAHNPAGMAAMVAAARELIAGRRCVAVFAAMRNKDVESMAAGLEALTHEIIVTAPAVERATPPAELSRLFHPPAESAAGVGRLWTAHAASLDEMASWWCAARSTSPAR